MAADIADQPDVLRHVIERNLDALSRARSLLTDARVVRLSGFGSSKHAAGYGAEALDVIAGLPASVLPAPGVAVPWPAPSADAPLVIVSQSGRTPALLDVAEQARSAGVAVIAVTNEPGSALENVAEVTLACGAGAERVVAATKSLTAQCLLLRALAADVPGDALDRLVVAVREAARIDLALPSETVASIIASGFAAEWVADEIALKITEMAGVAVTSNSLVEHFHGPKASTEHVIAFVDADDPNAASLGTMPNVTTVGPGSEIGVATTGDRTLDAIVTLVAGQRIARSVALRIGEDPDADRGLSKVTETR